MDGSMQKKRNPSPVAIGFHLFSIKPLKYSDSVIWMTFQTFTACESARSDIQIPASHDANRGRKDI